MTMMYAHLHGLSPTDPFVNWRRLILTRPEIEHILVLAAWADDRGYRSTLQGWKATDGRSLTGGLRIKGVSYKPPEEWEITTIVTATQMTLFNILLATQNVTGEPISLLDLFEPALYVPDLMREPVWMPGQPTINELGYQQGFAAYQARIDVDSGYDSRYGPDRYLLQFSAKQVI